MPGRSERNRRVVPIDGHVKKLLLHYVGLFKTYELAATHIGVNRSTIAVYMEGAANISSDVLEQLCVALKKLGEGPLLEQRLGPDWQEQALAGGRVRNFLQTDDTAYALNEGLVRFLELYTSRFPNRVRAARALDVNPRTFKAYVKQTISSFPRNRFLRALEVMEERGLSQEDVREALGIEDFSELLEPVVRPKILELTDNQALEELLSFHRHGRRSMRSGARPLYNFLERRYGGATAAVRKLTGAHVTDATTRFEGLMKQGKTESALQLLAKLDEVLTLRARLTRTGRKGRGKHKPEWMEEMRELVSVRNELRRKFVEDAPFHHNFMGQDAFRQFRMLHPNLKEIEPYSPQRTLTAGQLVWHPEFGVGRALTEPERGRVQVYFSNPEQDGKAVTLSVRQ